jgi:hypothetical protein
MPLAGCVRLSGVQMRRIKTIAAISPPHVQTLEKFAQTTWPSRNQQKPWRLNASQIADAAMFQRTIVADRRCPATRPLARKIGFLVTISKRDIARELMQILEK